MKKYILNPISLFFIGAILGIISKLLDILFVGNLFMMTLGYMFSDLPIWVLLGILISIYSDTRKKAGDVVTKDTVIGLQGGGAGTRKWESCSTGTHLHFGIAKGKIANNKYFISNWMANAVKPEGYPSAGGWFYSRTQWF